MSEWDLMGKILTFEESLVAQMVKNPPAGDPGSIPGPERSPGKGNGNSLQYSCWDIPWTDGLHVGYSPWGHKESDIIE